MCKQTFSQNFLLIRGKPPYPLAKDMNPEELEYVTTWLDHYELPGFKDGDAKKPIIGYVKEYKEQQDSGKTTFVLPPIPQ